MTKSRDCCESCAAGGECEGTPQCNAVAVEPLVLPPTFRIDPESGVTAPAGETTTRLYKPPHADGYRCLLQSYGFNAPTLDPVIVGLYSPTFIHIALVPRDTSRVPTDPNFAGAAVNRIILANAIVGFETFVSEEDGLKIPTDDNGRPWWLFVQIGSPLLLPTVQCGFNVSFAAKRAKWGFD